MVVVVAAVAAAIYITVILADFHAPKKLSKWDKNANASAAKRSSSLSRFTQKLSHILVLMLICFYCILFYMCFNILLQLTWFSELGFLYVLVCITTKREGKKKWSKVGME